MPVQATIDEIHIVATLHCKTGDRIVLLTLDTTGTTVGVKETAVSGQLPAQASCLCLITSLAARGSGPLLCTALSGSISTVLTVWSWICLGIHSRRALPSPVCA